MNKPSDIVIKRVLNNKGSIKEAKEVATWFATPEGEEWLSSSIDMDAMAIDKGMMEMEDLLSVNFILNRIHKRIYKRKLRMSAIMVSAIMIPCFLMLGVCLFLNNRIGGVFLSDNGLETVEVPAAKKKEIVFQDGSYVVLNSLSTLVYPHRFGLSERKVELLGEAYFDIKSNALRPFIVEFEDKSSVKVLGTCFNIEAYEDSEFIKIDLLDGELEFNSAVGSYDIISLDRLIYNKKTKSVDITHNVSNISNSVSWKEDMLIFDDTKLIDLLSKLEKSYNVRFKIENNVIKSYTFTMNANLSAPLETILSDIESISKLKFEKREEGLYIVHQLKKVDTGNAPFF